MGKLALLIAPASLLGLATAQSIALSGNASAMVKQQLGQVTSSVQSTLLVMGLIGILVGACMAIVGFRLYSKSKKQKSRHMAGLLLMLIGILIFLGGVLYFLEVVLAPSIIGNMVSSG